MAQRKIDPELRRLIVTARPDISITAVTSLAGLSGNSQKIETSQGMLVGRSAPHPAIPWIDRQREYRLLRKLQGVSQPVAGNRHWLVMPWTPGEPLNAETFSARAPEIVELLHHLHHQPLTGYRLQLLPLLEHYWQQCHVRHVRWLQLLQRLKRQGEPRPLRLAPLHMDVHRGNLIHHGAHLALIDWEYAADGDVALELAALCAAEPDRATYWLEAYAAAAKLPLAQLTRQVQRWQPWLNLLMASWYQLRATQSRDPELQKLAQQSWLTL